jgi:hypothetical protein
MVETGKTLQQICLQASVAGIAVQMYYIAGLVKNKIETNKSYENDIEEIREKFLKIFPLTEGYKRDHTEVFLMKLSATNERSGSEALKRPGHEILLEIR